MSNYRIKGFSFAFGTRRGELVGEMARNSLMLLKENGTRWIALCVDQRVKKVDSREIRIDYNRNVTDVELIEFIKFAHENDMKVCLKPMINCDDGSWRADICFGDDEKAWNEWFYEYTGFMTRYAEIAEYTGCEMLCLGCEMLGMEAQEKHWRTLISKVREVYGGPLTYNTNHGHEMDAKWYDELDYLGTSAYFRMHKKGEKPVKPGNPIMDLTREDMYASWLEVRKDMEAFSRKYDKPLIFMEIGCRSARGCACQPWDYMSHELPYDEDEQADFYDSCMEAFKDSDFLAGFFWWDWSVRVSRDKKISNDTGFNIYGKKAEEVLKKYYL